MRRAHWLWRNIKSFAKTTPHQGQDTSSRHYFVNRSHGNGDFAETTAAMGIWGTNNLPPSPIPRTRTGCNIRAKLPTASPDRLPPRPPRASIPTIAPLGYARGLESCGRSVPLTTTSVLGRYIVYGWSPLRH